MKSETTAPFHSYNGPEKTAAISNGIPEEWSTDSNNIVKISGGLYPDLTASVHQDTNKDLGDHSSPQGYNTIAFISVLLTTQHVILDLTTT
jgi:hypothetical protein